MLLGGNSPERSIKIDRKSILEALRKLNYDVRIIDPAYGLNQPDDEERYFSEEDYTGTVKQELYRCDQLTYV